MSEWQRPPLDPVRHQRLTARVLLRLAPAGVIRFWLGDPNDKREQFETRLTSLEDRLTTLRRDLEDVCDYNQYLVTPRQQEFTDRIDDLRSEFDTLQATRWPFRYTDRDRERIEEIGSDLQTLINRLVEYNDEFVQHQLDVYEELFRATDADDYGLNRAQREAVVTSDCYNQVIAGAGTGKTLTLTHRIAYLITRGVSPHRIAAITLTNKATDEIETRLAERFGITDVDVQTIHSFANQIAQEAAPRHISTIDGSDRQNFVEEILREETQTPDSDFSRHYRQFLTHYRTEGPDPGDCESQAEYVAVRAEQSYRTLADEEVASQAEKAIADFLFTHGVEYQYEAIADWADTAPEKTVYRPDFYLPEYDIYIEHWGIDKNGEVAPWFSWTTTEYLEKLTWAHEQFAHSDHTLLDTYEFEHQAGRLERALKHRLREHGVALDPMEFEDLVNFVLDEYEQQQTITNLFVDFIDHAQTFDTSPDEIRDRLPRRNPRKYHFGVCGAMLLERYEDWKADNDLQDFDDMIYNAIDAVDDHPTRFRGRYDHLLVDEFQDVAISQIRLIKQLTAGEEGPRLFCVGDDWQSIYAFRGAVVEYFIDFEEYFEPGTRTELSKTYRCPETVLAASTSLIRTNPEQIDKETEPCSGRDTTPRLHTIDGYNDWAYARQVGEYTATLVEQHLAAGSDPSDIMVLSRYDTGAPYTDMVKEALEERKIPYDGKRATDQYRPPRMASAPSEESPERGVAVFSAHQAKGREAPHVILLHAAADRAGFSPEVKTNELLNLVREVDTNPAAEERRLFYVGMTRAEQSLDLLTRRGEESVFLDEIDAYLVRVQTVAHPGAVGECVTISAKVDQLWDDTHETKAQAGRLTDDSGSITFVAWTNTNPPMVREGVWYEFMGVEVSEYQGDRELHFTAETTVESLT